jgi:hypothetical protein
MNKEFSTTTSPQTIELRVFLGELVVGSDLSTWQNPRHGTSTNTV